MTKLTANETVVIAAMYASEYHDGGERPWVWTFSVADRTRGVIPAASFPGVVASLNKKGLVVSDGDASASGPSDNMGSLYLTDAGVEVAKSAGIYNPK